MQINKFRHVTEAKSGDLLVFFPTINTHVVEPSMHTIVDITELTITTRFPSGQKNQTYFTVWSQFTPGKDYEIFSTEQEKMIARIKYG